MTEIKESFTPPDWRENVQEVLATSAIEGYTFTPEDIAGIEAVARGEITAKEATARACARYGITPPTSKP